eukprot:TRINITY_DN4454_c0_g1_i7.p1 TRINITY_DN4454_c0_g1~~TRINITY_DN4454_c0_g1_i7.p1  ORF type:complete len:130 (+),score=30.08 TRINITY_DN4454_c0_g1_i7:1-390(+)
MVKLGMCYEQGVGVEKNVEEAVRLYRQAVDMDEPSAMVKLGMCYEQGRFVEKNVEEAMRLYRVGVEKNVKEAVRLYQQARAMDEPSAMVKRRQHNRVNHRLWSSLGCATSKAWVWRRMWRKRCGCIGRQ